MGWNAADGPVVDRAKIQCVRARQAAYNFKGALEKVREQLALIQHDEKRVAMIHELEQAEAYAQKAYDALYGIDTHLNR